MNQIHEKISHYEWMLQELELDRRHKLWVFDQIRKLKEKEREGDND